MEIIRSILSYSIEDISADKCRVMLPELYQLKGVHEKNIAHHESVFEHSIAVYRELNGILDNLSTSPEFTDKKVFEWLLEIVDTNNGKYRKNELLRIVGLLHDIGKINTISIGTGGDTNAFQHELIGSEKFGNIGRRLGLTNLEIEYCNYLIKYHGIFFNSYDDIKDKNGNTELEIDKALSVLGNISLEVTLLSKADLFACKNILKINNLKRYNKLIKILESAFIKCIQE